MRQAPPYTGPMFARIHSAHASNGAIGNGVSEPRLGVLLSLIYYSSSEKSTRRPAPPACVRLHYTTHFAGDPKSGRQTVFRRCCPTPFRPKRPRDRGNPLIQRPRPWPGPCPHLGAIPRVTLCRRPAGLEEGYDLPVHVGEPFDKDEVARIVEDPQPGPGNGPGEGSGVGDGHVAVLRAVDHKRRRGNVPDVAREVEARTSPGLLVVGGVRRASQRAANLRAARTRPRCSARYAPEVAVSSPRLTAPSALKEPHPSMSERACGDMDSGPGPP